MEKTLLISTDVLDLMKYFPNSFINSNGELILSEKGNVYFPLYNKNNLLDLTCAIFEWCSRDVVKAMPYCASWRNEKFQEYLRCKFNNYLIYKYHLIWGFSRGDWEDIYRYIGNGIDHSRTVKFVESGFDFDVLTRR